MSDERIQVWADEARSGSSRRALLMSGLAGLVGTAGACAANSRQITPSASPGLGDATSPAVSPASSATPSASPVAPLAPGPDPTPSAASSAPRPSLAGDTRNAWAFAPLSNPSEVTVEGSVASQRAWSTSKVLVVAALVATAGGGDPGRLTAEQRRLIALALTASDAGAIRTLKAAIPTDPGTAMTSVLRGIGDTSTQALSTYEGTMTWRIQEQVRFMAELSAGRVVSSAASSYILSHLHPIASQQWGLATVGASAVKGGWLRANTETRQMGILDGYAVAIISTAGPAQLQSDGDDAHVAQMNKLALMLQQRLVPRR